MEPQEKLRLLKSLYLLDQIPEDKLSTLSDFLQPSAHKDGEIIFEEGSRGDSLYFVSTGGVRISKKMIIEGGSEGHKDLAILGPGDCFGEMALIDESVPRSARAAALGSALVFQLGRKDLMVWLDRHPTLAIGFFSEMVQVLSKRLRRSSNELTMLSDLSQWLLEPIASGRELLQKVLRHLVPHLEGAWNGGAYLFNPFNDELELVATENAFPVDTTAPQDAGDTKPCRWTDDSTCLVTLPGPKRPLGFLLLRSKDPLSQESRNETGRTLTTAAGLLTSALENIAFRTEDAMRDRLRNSSQRYASGI